jgi:hypothetical protein
MKRIVALAVAWLVCTSAAISAEPTADDYLNFFKPVVGEWIVKAKIGDKMMKGTFSCKLSPSKRCLVWYGSAIAPYGASQSVDGYDPMAKKWKGCAFSADGGHQVTTYLVVDPNSLKGNKAEFKCEATEAKANGEEIKWRWQTVFILGKDEWRILTTEQTKNGEKTPDEEYVYERKATAAEVKQPALPANIAKELEFFLGEWKAQGNQAGKTLTGRWSAKWAPQKQCILLNALFTLDGEEAHGTGISGWDNSKEEVVTRTFYSNGVVEDIRYKLASPGVLKGVHTVSAKGKSLKADCEVRAKQPNEWTFTSKANALSGNEKGDVSIRLIRLTAKPKK